VFPKKWLLISAAASVPHQDQKLRTGHKIRPVTTKETIVVGGRTPADVELESVPADWGPSLTKYRYVYRVTASCWSNREAGPSFRKSTDAYAQSARDRFDHLGALRILRSVGHDRDLPSVLVGHDRDGEIRRQLADGFHLEPDRGLEFFARFCWLLQSVFGSFGADAKSPV
jgi:hypothetical protein